jgi:ribosomal-protein-alanine N-acetyltransferase
VCYNLSYRREGQPYVLTAVRYSVRPMVPGDIPQVVDIERESFPSMWPQTTYKRELQNRLARYLVLVQNSPEQPPERPPAVPAPAPPAQGWRETVRRLLSLPPPPEPTKELILGFVGLWLMVGEAHIVTLAVRDAQRRRGLGELLLIVAIELAIGHGQEVMTLEVRRSNEAAVSLYEKYGFSRAGVRARYYDNREDALIMTTPSLISTAFRERYQSLKEAHQRRWGGAYSLSEEL